MRAALGAATLLAGVSLLATDAAYPLAGRVLGLQPLSRVRTARREIALVVAGDEASTLFAAAELRSAREHASFAFVASPGRRALGRLAAAGDQVIPQLRPTGFTSWFAAGDRLQDEAGALGLRRDTLYLAPGDGFSLGAELVARVGGRRPVTGSSTYGPHAATPHHSLRPGEVVALDLPAGAAAARVVVGRFLTDARRAGVRAVTLDTLVADRRR